jgi:enoyl-[acyl-carrier-protein] reductase (NADH)
MAQTAVFLASDEAKAISGADINVNSGVVMYLNRRSNGDP